MTDDQVHQKQNARSWSGPLRRSRRMQGMGGLVLTISCLFPAIDGCGGPYVPANEIRETLAETFAGTPGTPEKWLWIIRIGMPYIVGMAFCAIVARWRGTLLHRERCVGGTVLWLVVLWIGTVSYVLIRSLIYHSWRPFNDPAFTIQAIVCACSMIYVPSAIRNRRAGRLCIRWYAVVCCVLWFGGWFVAETASASPTYYGLWLSLAGSLLTFTGTFQEARLVSITTPMETMIGLLTCRLRVVDPEDPRCAVCGYLLFGLPTNRCPECGNRFVSANRGPAPCSRSTHSKA